MTSKPDPMLPRALGRSIQVRRTDLGLDRHGLADLAGISYSYLAAIENGKKQPSIDVLTQIASALELTVADLVGDAEQRSSSDRRQESHQSPWFHQQSLASMAAPPPMAAAPSPEAEADLLEPDRYEAPVANRARRSGFAEAMAMLESRLSPKDQSLIRQMAEQLARRRR